MAFQDLFEGLEALPFAAAIAESTWMFPAIEVVHVLALVMVLGTIAMVDLRLLGLARRDMGVLTLTRETLTWTWACFVVAAITGALMFASAAVRYSGLFPFQAKMVLLALAGLNMAWFHSTAYRNVDQWDRQLPPPAPARIAGALSLSLWTSIIIAGRWIGFL